MKLLLGAGAVVVLAVVLVVVFLPRSDAGPGKDPCTQPVSQRHGGWFCP